MFVHWSNTETEYRDMESIEAECSNCQGIQKLSLRYYITKTKHYSVFAHTGEKRISAICHGCLTEMPLDDKYHKIKLKEYEALMIVWEAHDQVKKGNYRKALKQLDKALKKDPENLQAMYAKASALIDFDQKDEAKQIVTKLLETYPENEEILALQQKI